MSPSGGELSLTDFRTRGTGTPVSETPLPRVLSLTNYPNPFNPSTNINYQIEHGGPARLSVHDVRGRLVRTLVNEPREAGSYKVTWDGRDEDGQALPSGIYFARIKSGNTGASLKLVLMK